MFFMPIYHPNGGATPPFQILNQLGELSARAEFCPEIQTQHSHENHKLADKLRAISRL